MGDRFSKIEEIKVWQESVELSVYVYKLIADSEKFKRDFDLKDQA